MKNILIIGAMQEEIDPLIASGNFEKKDADIFPYYVGSTDEYRLIVTVSRIGKVAMASCVQHFITLVKCAPEFDEHEIDLIINMGVAGAISNKLRQGDLVVADRLCQHDMDVVGLGYEIGLNPDFESVYFDVNKKIIEKVKSVHDAMDTEYELHIGTIASGDQFISSHEKKVFIEETFGAYACEMEGAALAQVAFSNGVDFLVIRAISDLADGEAPMSYVDFKPKAIVNLTQLVEKYIGG
ncbi:MAG: 5'-methylthioadenosine/adenosylhomocysteine nucleosidase [Eubacterium sp.]|nr:5'-methylthioadenosine/adenosylhomocysteine nucleosidase [Eubacterium sp.]